MLHLLKDKFKVTPRSPTGLERYVSRILCGNGYEVSNLTSVGGGLPDLLANSWIDSSFVECKYYPTVISLEQAINKWVRKQPAQFEFQRKLAISGVAVTVVFQLKNRFMIVPLSQIHVKVGGRAYVKSQ